jgi:hypothetical protein
MLTDCRAKAAEQRHVIVHNTLGWMRLEGDDAPRNLSGR